MFHFTSGHPALTCSKLTIETLEQGVNISYGLEYENTASVNYLLNLCKIFFILIFNELFMSRSH